MQHFQSILSWTKFPRLLPFLVSSHWRQYLCGSKILQFPLFSSPTVSSYTRFQFSLFSSPTAWPLHKTSVFYLLLSYCLCSSPIFGADTAASLKFKHKSLSLIKTLIGTVDKFTFSNIKYFSLCFTNLQWSFRHEWILL